MKVDYNIMAIEVEKLYAKVFPPDTPEKEIADHCEYIAKYIEACGWSTDDYLYESYTRLPNLNPPKINPNAN